MKKYIMYGVAVLCNILLLELSEEWYGAEWFFAILTLGVFVLSLQGWKRYSSSGIGLVFLTGFGLFMINSIFYLLMPPMYTILFSILFGLVLIRFLGGHQDAVITAWWVVVFNILIHVEVTNEVVFWFVIITTGIGSLIGFRLQSILFKRFFTIIFLLNAGGLLLVTIITRTYFHSLLTIISVVIFAVGAYLLESQYINYFRGDRTYRRRN